MKKIKKNRQRCRFLLKKTLHVTMGLLSNYNLMKTPAFYISQVDIFTCQLLKACENKSLDFYDIKYKLNEHFRQLFKVDCEVWPVGAHNIHRRVERKFLEIKKSMEKSYSNERLSTMQWETAVAEIGNAVNNLPIALGNISGDFEGISTPYGKK